MVIYLRASPQHSPEPLYYLSNASTTVQLLENTQFKAKSCEKPNVKIQFLEKDKNKFRTVKR